jgi:hypothetical protein
MVNINGDEVVPYTNQVMRRANEGGYVPTQEEREAVAKHSGVDSVSEAPQAPVSEVSTLVDGMSIQQQIEAAEKHLESLKMKKKEAIEAMKKQLEMLESE